MRNDRRERFHGRTAVGSRGRRGRRIAPAPGPGDPRGLVRIEPATGRWALDRIEALPEALRPGDLVVVNDAATLPASLVGEVRGLPVELRLARPLGGPRWTVALLGSAAGPLRSGWRTPTERRGPPPAVAPGDVVALGAGFRAVVEDVDGPRLATVRLEAPDGRWLDAVHRHGEPVRYSYLRSDVPLGAFQTPFATHPVASESPSAALPVNWGTVLALRARGVEVASLTHAAGLSSIDGGDLDRALPLPERSAIPETTVAAVGAARRRGGRVVAVGTTVVRALEGRVAAAGALEPGAGETTLVIGPGFRPGVTDGLLTKIHAPEESHFAVLAAYAPPALLEEAFEAAAGAGYHNHEFGDSALIL